MNVSFTEREGSAGSDTLERSSTTKTGEQPLGLSGSTKRWMFEIAPVRNCQGNGTKTRERTDLGQSFHYNGKPQSLWWCHGSPGSPRTPRIRNRDG